MSNMIAVYGTPGAGRSAFSAALAAKLARRKNVILLSTDRIVPMLKVFAPSAEINQTLSVGGLFLSDDPVSQEEVCKRIVFHPKCANLGFMALATGDTPNTYNEFWFPDKIKALYGILLNLTDVLIVDCSRNISPSNDPLGFAALNSAALLIKLLTPNIHGVEYNISMFPLLQGVCDKKHITAFVMCLPGSPVDEVSSVLGREIKYRLPRSDEIAGLFDSGRLVAGAHSLESREYLYTVEEIAREAKV